MGQEISRVRKFKVSDRTNVCVINDMRLFTSHQPTESRHMYEGKAMSFSAKGIVTVNMGECPVTPGNHIQGTIAAYYNADAPENIISVKELEKMGYTEEVGVQKNTLENGSSEVTYRSGERKVVAKDGYFQWPTQMYYPSSDDDDSDEEHEKKE